MAQTNPNPTPRLKTKPFHLPRGTAPDGHYPLTVMVRCTCGQVTYHANGAEAYECPHCRTVTEAPA